MIKYRFSPPLISDEKIIDTINENDTFSFNKKIYTVRGDTVYRGDHPSRYKKVYGDKIFILNKESWLGKLIRVHRRIYYLDKDYYILDGEKLSLVPRHIGTKLDSMYIRHIPEFNSYITSISDINSALIRVASVIRTLEINSETSMTEYMKETEDRLKTSLKYIRDSISKKSKKFLKIFHRRIKKAERAMFSLIDELKKPKELCSL